MDFIKNLEVAFGLKATKIMMDMQPGDVVSTYADSSRLRRIVGFEPTTQLSEGVKNFAKWYREYFNR